LHLGKEAGLISEKLVRAVCKFTRILACKKSMGENPVVMQVFSCLLDKKTLAFPAN